MKKQILMPKGYKKDYTESKRRTPLGPTGPILLPTGLYNAVKASPVGIVPPGIMEGIARTRLAASTARTRLARIKRK